MATMVSSVAEVDEVQVDGRAYVVETHTDSNGAVYRIKYLAEAGADVNAKAAARAQQLLDAAVQQEIDELLNG